MSTGVKTSSREDLQDRLSAYVQLQETVLGLIITGTELSAILHELCLGVERLDSGLLCSVLLLDVQGKTLRQGAAPSLPDAYNQAINGVEIGPRVGSCGTAAFLGQQVIVSDIAADPLWANCKDQALAHGLRACWSTPIAAQDGKLLGTFAIYYREPRSPEPHHLQLIAQATHLAVLALERDRAKAELSAAEARYRSLVEHLPAITYIAELGAEGPWHYVSPQIESILGYPPTEWLLDSRNWISRIHPDDREIVMLAEKRFQKNYHELFYAEYRVLARDGREIWFRDEGVLLPEDGRKPLMQGVMYDITGHKRLEEELRHSQKMEAIGQLAGGIAHDFNNFLMLIQAHNTHLRERIPAGDTIGQQDVQHIEQAVIRAASLTRQLLAFSRKQVLQTKVLDLNAIVTDVAKMLDHLLEKNVELFITLDPTLGRIKADPVQMEQIILNLAVNARDAMPQGGKLSISTNSVTLEQARARCNHGNPSGSYVMLCVTDTGTGMDADTQARIFEPFFTTKAAGKGTGLGLATVYGVVEQSGGWIWVSSELGKGTTFETYLPRIEPATEALPTPEAKPATLQTRRGGETILLVEDQEGIRDIACESLRRNGYTVLDAEDGAQALRVAGNHRGPIHLLLTDMFMPNLGGSELSARLHQLRPETKVLFMSGNPDHTAAYQETLPPGAVVLQKPFSLDELVQKVRSQLDNNGRHS